MLDCLDPAWQPINNAGRNAMKLKITARQTDRQTRVPLTHSVTLVYRVGTRVIRLLMQAPRRRITQFPSRTSKVSSFDIPPTNYLSITSHQPA